MLNTLSKKKNPPSFKNKTETFKLLVSKYEMIK